MPFVAERSGMLRAPKLEYNLVDHCNLACKECSHFSPLLPAHALELEAFARDVNRLAQVYRVKRFRFVGGEPLLNDSIAQFARVVRQSDICQRIEVVTNGTLLRKVSARLLQEIDALTVSIYPGCEPDARLLVQLHRLCAASQVKLRVERIARFRGSQVGSAIENAPLVQAIFDSCLIAHTWSCQTFYDGYFYMCSRPIYVDSYLRRVGGQPADVRSTDGVALHEPNLLARLKSYLGAGRPLKSCQHCLGTVGNYQPHSQLKPSERRRPIPVAARPEQRIDAARMRYLMWWHRMETAVLRRVPSARLSRALNAAQTFLIGD